jgi:hypothetical protein
MQRGAIGFLLVVAGCGGMTTETNDAAALGVGSCQQTSSMSGFTFRMCVDYTGLTADQENVLRMVCTSRDAGGVTTTGSYTKASCDRSGTLGGCRIASGGFSSTIWFWTISGPGTDITLYKDICSASSGTWVSP